MKILIALLLLAFSTSLWAQQPKDTIFANDKKNVALFFPNPIRQGITGSEHFVFTYNREKEQYFGLLQAKPGADSNLLTLTNDGQVYSYIIRFKKELLKLNYFINENESIGNERPKTKIIVPKNKKVNAYANRETYFQKFSAYLLQSNDKHISIKRKKGVKLRLQSMVYDVAEVYLVIEIENESGIDFEIDYLNISVINGTKKRKASYQKLQKEVIFKYKMPVLVKDLQSRRFVYVIPKFVLGENEKLQIELKELKGNRKISVEKSL